MNYYEINVSRNGKHFFATAPRSFDAVSHGPKAMQIIAADFEKRFPESEGFEVTVTYWSTKGQPLSF